MAVTSSRSIQVVFSQDVVATNTFSAANNTSSPGAVEIKTLAAGANTITPPAGGTTAKACTIIPPAGNTQSITLKGVTGDTGVALHKTDPSSIGLDSSSATFVLTAGAEIAGVRLVWS